MKNCYFLILLAILCGACSSGQKRALTLETDNARKNISDFEKKAQEQPQDATAQFRLAQAYEATGEPEKALEKLDRVLEIDPANTRAYLLQAHIQKTAGNENARRRAWLRLLNSQALLSPAELQSVAQAAGMPYPVKRLEIGPGNNLYPRFSPDGSVFVWQSDRDGNWNLYQGDLLGSAPSQLTIDAGDDEQPVFSPGGHEVIYTSTRDEFEPKAPGEQNRELYALPLNTKNPRRLTHNKVDDWGPVFSRDSLALIFASENGNNRSARFLKRRTVLRKLALADSSLEDLTPGTYDDTAPATLPGGKIAWIRIEPGKYSVLTGIPVENEKVVYSSAAPKSGLAASVDGRELCFFMKDNDNIDLYLLSLTTGKLQRVTASAFDDFMPGFAPGGGQLLFASNREGRYKLYVLDIASPISRAELASRLETLLMSDEISAAVEE